MLDLENTTLENCGIDNTYSIQPYMADSIYILVAIRLKVNVILHILDQIICKDRNRMKRSQGGGK